MSVTFVSPAEIKAWLDKEEVVICDVREASEQAEGVIPGAILTPLSRFDPAMVPDLEGRKLVFHCQLGRRCGPTAEIMIKAGFDQPIYRMEGGFAAWRKMGGPETKVQTAA